MKAAIDKEDASFNSTTTGIGRLVNPNNLSREFTKPEQEPTQWKLLQEEYKNNTIQLKEKYSELLSTELLSKQSKDTYTLASVFRDIANSNRELAQADATTPSLKLQYYNDAAIACYHALSVIEKASGSNKSIKLQELKNEIYASLNDIQKNIVSVGGGNPDKLPQINSKSDADNIAKRDILEQLRSTTKDQLQAIEVAKEDRDDISYIERTASLFKQIASEVESYLAELYKDAQSLLGSPPCDYTVIGLGSMSLRQITPYSDLEFAILTKDEDYKKSDDFKVREYFKNLTQIVHFKVINLGETIMPISNYGFDFKEFINTAVNFDLGGKTPLGRMDKPYELIQTVENMFEYLRNEEGRTMHMDKTLQNIVQKICPVYQHGESNLAAEYQSQAQEFLLSIDTNGRPYCENRAVQILSKGGIEMDYTKQVPQENSIKGNLEQFAFDPQSEGKLFDVKQEIYRMPDRFIYYLGVIYGYGVQEESSWDTIDKLCTEGIISEKGAFNLKKALSFATNLRLKAYSYYGCQKEVMDYAKAYEVTNAQSKDKLIKKELTTTFRLNPEDLQEDGALFEYYYVALALTQKLQEFCNLPEMEQRQGFFADTKFYQTDAYIKAQINTRLMKYKEALKYQLKELEIMQNSLGENHLYVANILGNIGLAYQHLGRYNEALEYREKALQIFQNSLGEDHRDLAQRLHNLGETYRALFKHNEALKHQEKALAIWQKYLPENHPDIAASFNSMGVTCEFLNDHDKALEFMKQALAIWQKSLEKDHPHIATSLNNIGVHYEKLSNYEEALKYLEQALEIRQKSLGSDHPDVAYSLNNIGTTYGGLGSHSKALEYKEKALAIWQKTPSNHPNVAQSLNNIGTIYVYLGNHSKALECLKQALEIRQKSLGGDHPDVATILNNIGSTYEDLGNHHKALEYKIKALEILQHTNNPNIINIKLDISGIYCQIGMYNNALAELAGIMFICKKTNQQEKISQYSEKIVQIQRTKRLYEETNILLNNTILQLEDCKTTSYSVLLKNLNKCLNQFKECNSFIKSNSINEDILRTLNLLINAQSNLYQDSTKNRLNILKQLNIYKKEYDVLKKTIEDKQLKLQEIEEYLLAQKQAWEEKDKEDLADKILTTIEENSSFEDMSPKADNTIRVVSYNIVADFFDDRDKTPDHHHHWQYRAPFVKILLKGVYPDVICLQELSAEQALELNKYFGSKLGYKSIFLSQTPSEIKTGAIAYGEEVAKWQGKFLGASLIGTFINKSFEFVEIGRFWLNENPDIIPHITDRGATDKGFGNMNTYRAVLWAKLQIEDKLLFIFNSHYPLSGNNETRFKCAELEMNKIKEIAGENPWISVGDKNIIPTKDDDDLYNTRTIYEELIKNGKNIVQCETEHKGIATTWIGFTYDEHKNNINTNGEFEDPIILDVIVSNLASVNSFHHHGAFDPAEHKLLSLTEMLTPEQNEQRYFASDHALIGADLVLE